MKEILSESGIRNINQLRKDFKNAKIFYHIDLDGVTSALAMKKYLEDKGFKVIGCEGIQYGDKEYSVQKSDPAINLMNVLVDFAHGKPMFHIMTDHHDRQAGVEKDTSTSFRHSRSNVETLSQIIPTSEIFPPEDVKIVSMVDSADYAKNEVTPEMVMNYIFDFDKDKGLANNKLVLGLVTNKMLLAFKNKPGFLDTLVMECKPSLMSIFQKISSIVKDKGWPGRETLEKNKETYVASMKTAPNVQVEGPILVQYGGGNMMKPGSYDRYTPFKNNPEADFLVIAWPLGLLQASCNPFKKERELKGVNLGEIAQEVLSKWEGQLKERDVKLSTIKWISESSKDFGDQSVGFTYKDFLALYSEKYSVMENGEKFLDIIYDLMEKPFSKLSEKELEVLDNITVPAWDLIQANSGGHKCITNISGLNFLGRSNRPPSGGYKYNSEKDDSPYIKFLKMLQKEFVKVLTNKINESKSGKTIEETIIDRVKKKILKEDTETGKLYSEDFPTDLKELLDKVNTEIPEIKKENICRELTINGGGYIPDNNSVDTAAEKDVKKLLGEFNTKFSKDAGIVSGYRSWENQIDNFKNKVSGSRDVNDVQNSNSIPGFSQHHSGKCFDIYSVNLSDWTEEMKNWVEENVGKYGFKVTYKENVDGRIAEPWHIAKEEVEFKPINNWNQWCETKGEGKKEVTFKNFDFDKLENQNLKGSNLFKLLLIIFGIGKLMTPEGREFLKKIKERLFNKKEESVSSGSSDVLGYPLKEFSDKLCGGCTYGKPREGGRRSHAGIDLAAKSGTEVLAPLDGEVVDSAIRDNACGGTIGIEHGEVGGHKTKTRYCHIKELKVSKGQKVKKGDVIGISGGASGDVGRGSSSGAHLHFELYKDGKHLDPKEYVLSQTEEGRKKLWA